MKLTSGSENLTDQYSSDKVELITKNELKDNLLAENLLQLNK